MSSPAALLTPVAEPYSLPPECLPNYDLIRTEDDEPVDKLFSERNAKLLTDTLYASWSGPEDGRPFLAMSNVGLFFAAKQPPLVPDFLLSLDVEPPEDVLPKEHRSYFVWNYGKFPDVVIEIVSNTEGSEASGKLRMYAKMGIRCYVIFDPMNLLGGGVLRVLTLQDNKYEPALTNWMPGVELGLTLWDGHYAGIRGNWLRWCDQQGRVLLTGDERAIQEQQRADQEQQRANDEQQRADEERQRADQQQLRADAAEEHIRRLTEKLQALGIRADEIA
ncbi:MAG: Uma2 family endonuclease [Planctomycetaceae bacterium]